MLLEIFAVLFHVTIALSKSGTVDISNHDNTSPGHNESHFIRFEKHQRVVTTVSDKFLSFSIDMALLRNNTIHIPISNVTFINLAQHLKPAYVRIGGTAADFLHFNEKTRKVNNDVNTNSDYDFLINESDKPINNFTFTGTNFLSLFKFSQITGNRLLFDLNVLLRNSDGSWDSDNPEKIVLFAKAHKMELDWQLGNEPNSFPFNFNIAIPAEQLSQDYCKLRNILQKSKYAKESILVGPEVNHIDDGNPRGVEYAKHFLQNVNNCIDYITCHQYYLHGQIAKIEDFVNPAVFNSLHAGIKNMQEMLKSSGKNISMWISETSSASGGGAPELSDRYVAGFLWLDKLGVSAKAGVKVVVRQTLLGGHYAMVSHDFEPNPDWWVSVLFKKFVSGKVLNLITPDDNLGRVRLYAHCAVPKNWLSSQIVIYGMNLNSEVIKIRFDGLPKKRTKALAFYLTSDSLRSRDILLNGKVLRLESDGNLPYLRPQIVNISQPIELPAFSMVFLLLNNVESSPC